jgi:hypothetical protein
MALKHKNAVLMKLKDKMIILKKDNLILNRDNQSAKKDSLILIKDNDVNIILNAISGGENETGL